jgi:hypothetical protein
MEFGAISVGNWQFWMSQVSSSGAWIPDERALGFLLYPYVFVAGPNKHDCSRLFSSSTAARKILTISYQRCRLTTFCLSRDNSEFRKSKGLLHYLEGST